MCISLKLLEWKIICHFFPFWFYEIEKECTNCTNNWTFFHSKMGSSSSELTIRLRMNAWFNSSIQVYELRNDVSNVLLLSLFCSFFFSFIVNDNQRNIYDCTLRANIINASNYPWKSNFFINFRKFDRFFLALSFSCHIYDENWSNALKLGGFW